MMPHSKKRRRRKKNPEIATPIDQQHNASAITAPIPPTSDIPKPPARIVNKPRVSETFKREEHDVLQALRQYSKNTKDISADSQRDREIDFFVDAIQLPNVRSTARLELSYGDNNDDDDADIVPDPKLLTTSSLAEDEKTITTVATEAGIEDGLQLASSFVQIEDEAAIRPWTPKSLDAVIDEDLFFDCHESLQVNDEISLQSVRDVADDGLFVPSRPVGFSSKAEKFIIDRLLASGHPAMVQTTNGVKQLVGVHCVEEGKTIYPRRIPSKMFKPVLFDSRLHSGVDIVPAAPRTLNVHVQSLTYDQVDGSDEERSLTDDIHKQFISYATRQSQQVCGHVAKKLQAIRQILKSSNTEQLPGIHLHPQQIAHYRMKRRDLRHELHREQHTDRQILRTILEQWKRLKDVRQKQGYAGTGLKLVIHTHECSATEDQQQWEADFNVDLNEELEEAIEFYEQARLDKNAVDGTATTFREPIRPNPNDIQAMLHDIYGRSRRHPGEPSVRLELDEMNVGDHAIQLAQSVQKRMQVQLVVDKSRVTQLKLTQLIGQRVELNAVFGLEDMREPSNCRLQIFEDGSSSNSSHSIEMILHLPHSHELYRDATYNEMSFTTKSSISGRVSLKIGWSESKIACSNKSCLKPMTSTKKLEPIVNMKVDAWYREQRFDPMDPDVASLCNTIKKKQRDEIDESSQPTKSSDGQPHRMFRLNEDLTAFCSKETIDKDERFNMLIARYAGSLKLNCDNMIPPIAREIEDKACNVTDDEERIIEDLNWMDPIDMQRHRGKKYLLSVYRKISEHCDRLRKHSSTQDLLIGNDVPTVASFFATVRQLLSQRSAPLDPQRHRQTMTAVPSVFGGRSSLKSHASFGQGARTVQREQCRLVVNVLRAQGVPCRPGGDLNSDMVESRKISTVSSVVSQRLAVVNPYAVVSVRDKSIRTSTAEGSNPTWNEQLVLSLCDSVSVDPSRDTLCVQLFDEVVEDLLADEDRTRSNEIYQRISSRWLGELRIPMYTILMEKRIEGTFEMTTPQILLGYSKAALSGTPGMLQPSMINVPQIRNNIFVTLFVHLEPTIVMPSMNTTFLESTETTVVTTRIANWLDRIREEFPQRCFDPLVALSNGKRVCITRLVGPIELPFERSDVTEFLIRRFVALIPSRRVFDVCSQLNGVWLANDQVMTLLTASAKDLGTMLVSFYLALGHRAFLAIGHAHTHGDTAFILFKENGVHHLIDATTGRKYAATDTRCPLRRVYAIVGPSNVWTNIQREQRVFQTRFNVTNGGDWRPLFGKSPTTVPTGIVHNATFTYTASNDTGDLRRLIEWKLMKKISSWRTHRKTVWNRNLNEMLLRMLQDLEEDACFEYETKGYMDRMQHLQAVYQMNGYPVHMAYCSMSTIVERVRATGIHLNADGQVEFSLTVHVQPYPCNVLSVWVFLLALVPKN